MDSRANRRNKTVFSNFYSGVQGALLMTDKSNSVLAGLAYRVNSCPGKFTRGMKLKQAQQQLCPSSLPSTKSCLSQKSCYRSVISFFYSNNKLTV